MTFVPNPRQALYLVKLLAFDDGWQYGLKTPLNNTKERAELLENGLIEIPDEKKVMPTSKKPVKYVILGEKGWSWIARNMDAELSKTQEASLILSKLFSKLKVFLDGNEGLALANLFSTVPDSEPAAEPSPEPESKGTEKAVREAYLKVSGGRWKVRVRLSELRKAAGKINREELDAALHALEKNEKLVMYSLYDPAEIGQEDDAAAVEVLGRKRHIVYMEE